MQEIQSSRANLKKSNRTSRGEKYKKRNEELLVYRFNSRSDGAAERIKEIEDSS